MKCMVILRQQCSKGHTQKWHCHSGGPPSTCLTCDQERRDAERKVQKALKEKLRREEQKQRHLREVTKIQEQIDEVTEGMKDMQISADQKAVLEQKKKDLAAAKERASKKKVPPQNDNVSPGNNEQQTPKDTPKDTSKQTSKPPQASISSQKSSSVDLGDLDAILKNCMAHNKSESKTEWQRQKDQENACNPAIDEIMDMIGLEDVKSQVLRIKAKVETATRQGTDLKKERLGLVLLGNPGTGLYKFQVVLSNI